MYDIGWVQWTQIPIIHRVPIRLQCHSNEGDSFGRISVYTLSLWAVIQG